MRRWNGPENSGDAAYDLAIDNSGNVYVTGESYGNPLFARDYSTVKYLPNGDTAWVRRYAKWGDQVASAIAIDDSNNIYVTGISGEGPEGWELCTIKYLPSGDTVWVRRYPGDNAGWWRAYSITVDRAGNVYVTGTGRGSTEYDYAYVTIKYHPNGDTIWVRKYNGPGNSFDRPFGIAVDDSNYVYVTGESGGGHATIKYYPNGDTAWVRSSGSGGDKAIAVDDFGNVYVTGGFGTIKYNANGNQLWIGSYGGYDIALDGANNVYVTNSDSDYVTTKYYPNGDTAWMRRYSGTGNGNAARAIAVDGSGNVYVTGYSYGSGTDWRPDYATVKYVQTQVHGIIAGNVKDASSQQNLQDVLVEALQESLIIGSDYSATDGNYNIPSLPAGFYDVRAQKPGYETKTFNAVQVIANQTTTQDFNLNPSPEDTILYDDFSGKALDWQFEGPCTWLEENDVLWTSATGNRVFCLATAGEPTWTDYIYEVDVYGIAGVDKCMEFRVQDYNNHYYINLRSDWPNQGNDSLYFCKIVDGACVYYESVDWSSQNNTWYHLRVEAIGKRFRVYVDDNFVLQYVDEDSPFLQGKIGAGCWVMSR